MTSRPVGDRPILITGGTGQVGYEMVIGLEALGSVWAPSRTELDLARPDTLRATVRRMRPSLIVNAAGYTAVDSAESDRELCMTVNAEAPRALAEAAREIGAPMVHFSTDYVFDGRRTVPYREDDPPAPLGVYGESKARAERAIRASGAAHLIFRISWVYGTRGTNFFLSMLRLARERRELRVVADQHGAPTWSRSVAAATVSMLEGMIAGPGLARGVERHSGTYHLSASGETTWYEFARSILAADPRRAEHICERVVPIATDEFPTAARRPLYSVLDNALVRETFGVRLPAWDTDLLRVIGELDSHPRSGA